MVVKEKIKGLRPARAQTAGEMAQEARVATSRPEMTTCFHRGQAIGGQFGARGYKAFQPLYSDDHGAVGAPVVDVSGQIRRRHDRIVLCAYISGLTYTGLTYDEPGHSFEDSRELSPIGVAKVGFSLEQIDENAEWQTVASYEDPIYGTEWSYNIIPYVLTNAGGGSHYLLTSWSQLTSALSPQEDGSSLTYREGLFTHDDISSKVWDEVVLSISSEDLQNLDPRFPVRIKVFLGVHHRDEGEDPGDFDIYPQLPEDKDTSYVPVGFNGFVLRSRMYLRLVSFSVWGV